VIDPIGNAGNDRAHFDFTAHKPLVTGRRYRDVLMRLEVSTSHAIDRRY
jgi:hypothetical protein